MLPEESEKQFTCLGEHTEKYITFSVSIEKVVPRIDKKGKEITKTISYRLQFIDSARFMASSLSDLVNDLAKASCKINKNTIMIKKSGKLAELNKKIVSVFLNTKTLKMVS